MAGTPTLVVTENRDAKRFEARADGELVGVIEYIPLAEKIIATHTEVAEEHEGKGIGSALVRGMVDQLRDDGRKLQPKCPYVAAWLRRHPDQADVVDEVDSH